MMMIQMMTAAFVTLISVSSLQFVYTSTSPSHYHHARPNNQPAEYKFPRLFYNDYLLLVLAYIYISSLPHTDYQR